MASFAVSDTTNKILRNFAGVSNSILLVEGQVQKTVASGKSVLAIAELPEAWPKETGIYDLGMFLGTLSSFKQPGIEFDDDAMVISQGRSRVRYRYSDPSTILTAPNKSLKTDNPAVEFTLNEETLTRLKKQCSLLQLESVTFSVEDGKVLVRAADPKNPASHAFEHEVEDETITLHDEDYSESRTFKTEYLGMLLDGSYRVALAGWPYGYFVHESEPVSYFIVAQS